MNQSGAHPSAALKNMGEPRIWQRNCPLMITLALVSPREGTFSIIYPTGIDWCLNHQCNSHKIFDLESSKLSLLVRQGHSYAGLGQIGTHESHRYLSIYLSMFQEISTPYAQTKKNCEVYLPMIWCHAIFFLMYFATRHMVCTFRVSTHWYVHVQITLYLGLNIIIHIASSKLKKHHFIYFVIVVINNQIVGECW